MKFLLKFITIVSIFISFLYSGAVDSKIVNIADIEYTIDGIDKNQTTNEVTNTIVATEATIEFLKYSDSGEQNTLRPTKYKDSSGNFVDMPDAKLKDGTTITTPASVKLSNATTYSNEDLIVIRVTDLDQNIDSTKIDTITITITDPNTGDKETLTLQESSPNSGEFIGYTQAVSSGAKNGDGKLSVLPDDKITATYNDNGTNREVVTKANIIIDKTDATIEFLAYNPKGKSKETLPPTECLGKDGEWHKISSANLHDDDKVIKAPASLALESTNKYYNRDLVVIKVTDSDQNIHSDEIDYVEITVNDPSTKDSITLKLQESDVNSGIFIGFTQSVAKKTNKSDCELSVNPKDKIYAKYRDESQNKTISDIATIEIEKTKAEIDFLKFSENNSTQDSNGTVILKPTMCYSNGAWHKVSDAELPNGDSVTPPKEMAILDAKEYYTQDFVIIRLKDFDQNIHDDQIDSVKVNVTNPATGDKVLLELFETKEDSGVFVGYTHTTPDKTNLNDCRISVKAGDLIYTKYFDESHGKYRVDSAKIKELPFSIMVTKKASKDEASIGEFVKYTVSIKNLRLLTLKNITLYDKLPDGLKFIVDSFKANGKSKEAMLSKDGKTLTFKVARLSIGETKEFSYVATVTSNAKDEAINQAWADGRFGIKSNVATHKLKIIEELYRKKGFIVGKVYNKDVDCNKTVESNSNKICGVKGVKIYMEDGRYAITDKEGRYHFLDVDRGTHVVQVDELTIKDRYKIALCNNSTRFANRGHSQFVDILHSELRRADFCLKPLPQSKFKSLLKLQISKIDKSHLELTMQIDSTQKLLEPEVYIALPDGVSYVAKSTTNGKEAELDKGVLIVAMDSNSKSVKLEVNLKYPIDDAIEAMLYYDTKIIQDEHSDKVILPIISQASKIKLVSKEATTTIIKHQVKDAKGDFGWSKATKEQVMPTYSPEKLDEYGKEAQIIWPPKGWVPSIPSAKIVVLYGKDEHIELSLNGKKVSGLNYQKLFKNSDRSMRAVYYKGVDLAEGQNIITAVVKNRANRVIKTLTRDIWVESHLPESIEYLKEFSYLKADGKHTPIIAVKFLAKSGHPLRGGLVGSFEVDGDYKPYTIQNGKGSFKIDSDGVAYIRLKPTTKAGVAKLKFKLLDENEQTIEVKLTPHFRDWIVVGFAEGSVGYSILDKNSEPTSQNKIETKGKIALFAKGKIKGKWLLTLAYNSAKPDRELFDKIDPNRYYLLYGDSSEQKSEAASTKKVYIKLENETFYAMFGDTKSGFGGSKYMNYTRAFTGFRAEYNSGGIRVNTFIAKLKKVHKTEELRGDGTNGYYYLNSKDIVENSESIKIEIRDRLHPETILESKTLSRFSDYDIDYTKGRLFFKEPIYSVDKKLNPQYIVVEYDLESDDSSKYSWGVDASYKKDKIELTSRVISEDNLHKNYLYGASAKYSINSKSSIYAELAHSRVKLIDSTIEANARYAELKYSDSNFTIKAWYRYKDNDFGLDATKQSTKAIRDVGIKASKKLNKHYSASLEVSNLKEYNSTTAPTTTAFAKVEYKDKNTTASIGFRHIKAKSSGNQIVASYTKKMLDNNLTLSLEHEQNIGKEASSNYPTLTTLEANYKVDKNTTVFANISREFSKGKSSIRSQVGLSYKPWKDADIKLSRTTENGGDIDSIYNVLTLRQKFILTKHYTLNIGYEKGYYEKGDGSSFDAINSAIEYKNRNITAHLAIGGRVSDIDKKLNIDLAYSIKQSENKALAFGAKSNIRWSDDTKSRTSSAQLSYAYRPIDANIVILDKLEFKEELSEDNTTQEHTLKLINNMHINWRVNKKWELGLQYGLKYIIDQIDKEEYSSWVDLMAIFAQYDYNDNLSFGAQASVLHAYSSNNFKYGFGVYATKTLWDNAEVTLGYNIKGFKDSDFNLQNNFNSKVYLRFRIKFDQYDLKSLLKGVEQ